MTDIIKDVLESIVAHEKGWGPCNPHRLKRYEAALAEYEAQCERMRKLEAVRQAAQAVVLGDGDRDTWVALVDALEPFDYTAQDKS